MRSETSRPIEYGQVIFGSGVLLAGLVFWLYHQGHLGLRQVASLWPLAVIGLGLAQIAGGRLRRGRRKGWGLTLVGCALLFGNLLTPAGRSLEVWLGILPLRVSWPLLLVIAGGAIAWRELAGRDRAEERR